VYVIQLITFFFSPERSPPIEEVIQSGVVPRFVEFLVREDFPQLQVYSCYLPSNILLDMSMTLTL